MAWVSKANNAYTFCTTTQTHCRARSVVGIYFVHYTSKHTGNLRCARQLKAHCRLRSEVEIHFVHYNSKHIHVGAERGLVTVVIKGVWI